VTTFLLDVNLLLALSDPMHVHHEAAHRWYADWGNQSWATCPLTENGFVRVASHPSYPNRPGDVPAVLAILRQLCGSPGHEFWPDDVRLGDVLEPDAAITHTQVTDVYLVGLAVRRRGRLATLDRRIPVAAVRGGTDALELVPAE
jgi:toxin-antitoxin system PIN domain toxin